MAVTQTDIDALDRAIASGVRSVTIGGQTVIYNTGDSLRAARDDMQRQLSAQNARLSTSKRSKQTLLFQNGRGL